MKKLLIFLISIPFIFSSCEQEDNTPQTSPPPNPIHGSWNLDSGVYYFVQGVIDQNNQEIILDGDTNFLPDNGLTYEWVISSNGTMTENYYQNNVPGQSETFNYTISNNTLTNLDDSHHWTITNLTSNNLSCNNDNINTPQTFIDTIFIPGFGDTIITSFEYHTFYMNFSK